ncbi:unnamed protein product [Didymodactylos carnosus]|uniref:CENP-V/GFA domain-containing protein n=1 Tax=Didymodactylos carnosus TaxID=1234261 RepID=A0A814T7J8_9BILA|nr:unnamed protein product [Didymodactylos carnosus]CAF1158189.1 unnamed protein product [Didymodactylos carnosus]CAF3810001.1 unnamed protein product [Didymodactylos carnosus]CAF3921599.1 unnamed protein product [Didymodactylos carnosus]
MSSMIPVSVEIEGNETEVVKIHSTADITAVKEQLLGKDHLNYQVYYNDQILNSHETVPADTSYRDPLLIRRTSIDLPMPVAKPDLVSSLIEESNVITQNPIFTGGCQCGKIRYALYSTPERITVCHCRMCQKAVGGPFIAVAIISTKHFAWTRGNPSTFASSSVATRGFCSNCGTPLSYQIRQKLSIEITIGSFDRAPELIPQEQIGIESCLKWALLNKLPPKSSDANEIPPSKIISYQHPDHETSEAEWLTFNTKQKDEIQELITL